MSHVSIRSRTAVIGISTNFKSWNSGEGVEDVTIRGGFSGSGGSIFQGG